MLNQRQKSILKDLAKAKKPISAQKLAEKYNVSLRTIRNDTDDIEESLKGQDAVFSRIPGVGMKIITKQLIKIESDALTNHEFYFLSVSQRSLLILLEFLCKENPLTLAVLSELYGVSVGTVSTSISNANQEIKKYGMSFDGVKNKGYFLNDTNRNLLKCYESFMKRNTPAKLYSTITKKENGFLDYSEMEAIDDCISYISDNLFMLITDHDALFNCLFLIYRMMKRKPAHKDRLAGIENRAASLSIYFEYKMSATVGREYESFLVHALESYTDYAENADISGTSTLSDAIRTVIIDMESMYPELKNNEDTLTADLTRHIKCSIDRGKLGISNENLLLSQIKAQHSILFNAIRKSSKPLQKFYPIPIDENEIGFYTLYFCESLQKEEIVRDARVMVVCNTGRGASKLLATRIINNFPDVHIVAMRSYIDIENSKEILQNIDLIISTIPVENIEVPCVVVSPLLTEDELIKIREAIWISKKESGTVRLTQVNDAIKPYIEKYTRYRTARKISEVIENKNDHSMDSFQIESVDSSEMYAEIVMDIFDLASQLYPDGLTKEQMPAVSGLIAHVLMAVPRWKKGDFISISDFQEMKKKHKKEYCLINACLDSIAKRLNIFIDPVEAIPILRYWIY